MAATCIPNCLPPRHDGFGTDSYEIHYTVPNLSGCRATLSSPSRRGYRGPLPPCPRHPPRPPLTAKLTPERSVWDGRVSRFPGGPTENDAQASDTLASSAARGRELAALLDPETPVLGVTTGTLHPEVTVLAVPATADGRNMTGKDFELTAGWGHYGTGKAVMPGQGSVVEREYTSQRRTHYTGSGHTRSRRKDVRWCI